MTFDERERDRDDLFEFYKYISNYDNLIIDISRNGGGFMQYWEDYILAPNIAEPIVFIPNHIFLQGTELGRVYIN